MRHIQVVHVIGQLSMGGMEKVLVEFARYADRERFDLRFVALGCGGAVAEEITAIGWPVTVLNHKGGFDMRLGLELMRTFRRGRAAVVHTHNTRPLFYAVPAARLAGVRRVIHTRHGQAFGASRMEVALTCLLARWTDRTVCVSRDGERIARANGLPSGRLRTIWNGIDLARFVPTDHPDGVAIAVGRLSPEKGFDTLIRAAAIVTAADPTFRLDVVGDGACMPTLTQLVSELHLAGVVRLLGQLSNIPTLLSRSRLIALASRTEGVSLTLLEGMACGLPVVATAVGGTPEVVSENKTGLLVPPDDPPALAAALLEVWRSPERGRAMGRAGRERVEVDFDARRMVAEYEKLYMGEQEFNNLRP